MASFPPQILPQIDREVPDLREAIAEGLAYTHVQRVERYIDEVMHSCAQTFPPGAKYLGSRRCTPRECFDILTKKQGKNMHETAVSDVFLMEYKFEYEGRILLRHMFLPFVRRGGLIYLSGSRFGITPILTDRVISIGITNVFVRLLKARITINRRSVFFYGGDTLENLFVVWSDIYNTSNKTTATGHVIKGNCTLVHYLFCKYGFAQTFKRFAGCDVVVGDDKTITPEHYPPDQWVICRSRQGPLHRPRGYGRYAYTPTTLRIAVPFEAYHCNTGEFEHMAKNLVAGFFYVVDLFPSRMRLEDVQEKRQWQYLLGSLIWPGDGTSGAKILSDVSDHITSLDGYLDALNKTKLFALGYPCNDVYELFGIIIRRFNQWVLGPEDRVRTMYDKELQILYFVCMGITSAISNLGFKLQAAQKKPLNFDRFSRLMNQYLKRGLIWKINSDHGEVSSQSTSGDNMALKITNQLVPQSESSRKSTKRNRVQISDPTKRLHSSIAEVGGYANLTKRGATGRSRLNPTVDVTETGLIVRKKHYIALLDHVQEQFARKS